MQSQCNYNFRGSGGLLNMTSGKLELTALRLYLKVRRGYDLDESLIALCMIACYLSNPTMYCIFGS